MRRSWRTSVLRGRLKPGLQLWECSTDHCWKKRHTTDTLYRYTDNVCSNPSICTSNFPQAYSATPFKWLKLFSWSTPMYSSAGHGCTLEWMLQTLFTSYSTRVTVSRVKNEGAKTGLIESHLIADNRDKWITLQPLSMHILYPDVNEPSLWGCYIFFGSV